MALEEKCGQLTLIVPWHLVRPDGTDADEVEEVLKNQPGHITGLSADDPARLAALVPVLATFEV